MVSTHGWRARWQRWFGARPVTGAATTGQPPSPVDGTPPPWPVAELNAQRDRIQRAIARPSATGMLTALQTLFARPVPPGTLSHTDWRDGSPQGRSMLKASIDGVSGPLVTAALALRNSPVAEAIVLALLDAGADPNTVVWGAAHAEPLLFPVVLNGSDALLAGCLAAGADPTLGNALGETVLHHLAGNNPGAARHLPALVAAGADVQAMDPNGETPLYRALAYHNPVAAQALLDHGANRHRLASNGTPGPVVIDRIAEEDRHLPRNETARGATWAWWERQELLDLPEVQAGVTTERPTGRRRL